jgi:hypothetical protein
MIRRHLMIRQKTRQIHHLMIRQKTRQTSIRTRRYRHYLYFSYSFETRASRAASLELAQVQ